MGTVGGYINLKAYEANLEIRTKKASNFLEKLELERELSRVRHIISIKEKRVKHDRT